jgi:hypothetical protein
VGIISEDFDVTSMADALHRVTSDQIFNYKVASNVAARKYNASITKQKIRDIVYGLL